MPQEVFILGSGPSILELTDKELEYVNKAPCRLALNRFIIHHKLARIIPTHVFAMDSHNAPCRRVIQRVFDVCIADNLEGITFCLDRSFRNRLTRSRLHQRLSPYWDAINPAQRMGLRNRAAIMYHALHGEYQVSPRCLFRVPDKCNFDFLSRTNWLTGGMWASSLEEPLFNFRGSLTSALNYVSIRFPDSEMIKLLGIDLNRYDHFFDSQIGGDEKVFTIWTAAAEAKTGLHATATQYKETNMLDKFGYMLESLRKNGSRLVCCNPHSLLVEQDLVPYSPVCATTPIHN